MANSATTIAAVMMSVFLLMTIWVLLVVRGLTCWLPNLVSPWTLLSSVSDIDLGAGSGRAAEDAGRRNG